MYQLTDDDLTQMHDVLLTMYKDIKSVCDRHGLSLIAAGGTALGAIRHHGFIPWDDDMDLFMFREDYEKLSLVFDEELGENYYLLAPGRKQGCNCFFYVDRR
jgi:lipopolysaccharide cholinephosphotransferase